MATDGSDAPVRAPANLRGALYSLLAYGIYSAHDVVVKLLGATYSPFQIVFFTMLFGFPVVTVMLMHDRTDGNLRPRHPWWLALRTVAMVISTPAAFYAFSVLPLAQTYTILFAAPLLITLLAIPILREPVGWRRGLAVLVGLAGVIIVLRPGSAPLGAGHLAALAAAITSAFVAVVTRKIGSDERSVVLIIYPMMAMLITMACALPFTYRPMPGLHLVGSASMALASFLGGLFVIFAYRNGNAVVVAPMQYSQLIWAVLYGALVFDERPDLVTAIGAAIIILSGIYVVLREEQIPRSDRPVQGSPTRYLTGTLPRLGALLRRRH
ncbi:MAG: DMT family transporter [Amaricoccus sp.]